MKSSFPFSLENIPRQKSFACLSLKLSSILTALLVILFSVLALAQCLAVLTTYPFDHNNSELADIAVFSLVIGVTIAHSVTLFLSALLLVGILREKPYLVKPWVIWMSIQVIILLLMFVFGSTLSMINHFAYDSLMVYIIEFLGLLIRFYMLTIVGSYYKQLEHDNGENEKLVKLINDSWYTA